MAQGTRNNLLTENTEIKETRRAICRRVASRSRGSCEFCLDATAEDFHEIRQRNNHIESLRLETGIYSEGNIIHLCRSCHQRMGQTTWGKMAMLWLLHKRYKYGLPEDFHARSYHEAVSATGE